MTEPLPSDARCPACGYPLSGLGVTVDGVVCPECGERSTPAMTIPRRLAHPPLWRSGMVPGLALHAFGCAGWLLYASRSPFGMMELMFFSFIPLVGTALIWLCVSLTIRVRSVDRDFRARTLLLSLLIAAAWVIPGAAVYLWALATAAEISASV